MKIVASRPPNFEKIAAVFPAAHREGVIFSYGDTIYSPFTINISPALMAHEAVHGVRQEAIGVEAWWDRYLVDPEFRYFEELIAHVAEYQHLLDHAPNRNARRSALKSVAKRLSGALYGFSVSMAQAERDILNGVKGVGPSRYPGAAA